MNLKCLDELGLSPDYKARAFTVVSFVEPLLYQIPRSPKLITDHGVLHSLNLTDLICEFVKNWRGLPFSSEEKYVLVLAAWLHDIGCLVGRHNHNETSVKIMSDSRFDFLEDVLSKALLDCLKWVIISHSIVFDIGGIPSKTIENVRLPLVCAVFRLIDSCEIARERISPLLFSILSTHLQMARRDLHYWRSHLSIVEIAFRGRTIEVFYRKGGIKEARSLTSGLAKDLENLNGILEQYGMSFDLSPIEVDLRYSEGDFAHLEIPTIAVPEKTEASELVGKLTECPRGKVGWRQYQATVEEILIYLFPQLGPPIGQSRTESGLHVRDFVLYIPYDVSGFWATVRVMFKSIGLVVECKDYEEGIASNDVVITAKYLKKKGLGSLGMLLSREKPDPQVVKQVVSIWCHDNKQIVILDDEDIVSMIKLREMDKDPSRIIDQKIFEYRQKVE